MQVLVAMGWIHSGATSFVHDDSTISSPSNLLRHLWQIPWEQSFPNLLLAGQTARRSQTWLPQNLHVLHGFTARFINLLFSSIRIYYDTPFYSSISMVSINFIKFHNTWFHEQHVNECSLATSAVGNRSKMCACSRVSWLKSATSSKPWDNKPLAGSSRRVKPKKKIKQILLPMDLFSFHCKSKKLLLVLKAILIKSWLSKSWPSTFKRFQGNRTYFTARMVDP